MKVLNIISSAYRATLEEQDDTIVWLSHMLAGAGAEIDILLRGPAANYIVKGQEAGPLSIGGRRQKHAPDVHGQVVSFAEKGGGVFVIEDDLKRRGLAKAPALAAVEFVSTRRLPRLFERYDFVWHW